MNLEQLKKRLEEVQDIIPETFLEQRDKNREMYLLSREIERLEDPESYARNRRHWDGHTLRM